MRTRIIGIVLIVVGLGVAAWLIAGLAEAVREDRSITGHVLGLVLFSLPFFAVGLYLLLTSRGEIKAESKADKQRTILNAVMTRGRVSVADLAIECNLTREQVKDHIYDLIGKDLFRGYVNWEQGRAGLGGGGSDQGRHLPQLRRQGGVGRQGPGALPVLRHRDLSVAARRGGPRRRPAPARHGAALGAASDGAPARRRPAPPPPATRRRARHLPPPGPGARSTTGSRTRTAPCA